MKRMVGYYGKVCVCSAPSAALPSHGVENLKGGIAKWSDSAGKETLQRAVG